MLPIFDHLPDYFTGASAWQGQQLRDTPAKWIYTLSGEEIKSLEAAATHYLSLGRDIGEISPKDFPLGGFADHVQSLQQSLLNGIGFEIIRGLPIEGYTKEFAATIFCGVGSHLGTARSQNAQGHILGHVRDIGADANDPNSRIYQTNERQTFHTDSADVVALMCLNTAQNGGDSLLVSAETIYNKMKATRPDLLAVLFYPIATDRRGEIPDGAKPYMEIPILSWHEEHLTVFYQRQYIESAQRFENAIPLTSHHIAALDMFDKLANNPELHLSMSLVPGDVQFVYNHSQLHDRTGFIDWPDVNKRRHMMRLWLSLAGDRSLPECFKERYGSIEIGNRGGIVTANTVLHAPLD
ncbi:MAG: TauD/TfdA family dioxygenase [Granulosicoccaceae bacterium]